MSPKTNSLIERMTLKLEGQMLLGTSQAEISGYYKIDFFNQLEAENTSEKINAYYTAKLQKGNNKFLINELSETNKFDYDKHLLVDYSFNIADYAKIYNDEIFINLNLSQNISVYKTEDDRQNDTEVKYKSYYDYENILEIPDTYVIDYVPDSFSMHNAYFDCEITYEVSSTNIVYRNKLEMKFLNLNPKQQKEVNTAIKMVEKNFKEIVVLKKS
jgi:hypothetical protein